MYQRNTTNNDNRKHIVIQNNFTFQRQYNTQNFELQIQFMQFQLNQMQIDNMFSGGDPGGGGGDDPNIGTM